MKYIVYLFFAFLLLISCNKQEDTVSDCNVDNPLEELEWLKEMIESNADCPCHSSLLEGIYHGQTVFYSMASSFYCDQGGFTLWDCNGNVVKEFRFVDADPDMNNIEQVKILFTCE